MKNDEKNKSWIEENDVIENYIFNRISDVDRQKFESQLMQDEALKTQLLNEKRIIAAIRTKGRIQRKETLRQRIQQTAESPAQGGRMLMLSAPYTLLKIAAVIALFVFVPSVVYMVYDPQPEKAAFVEAEIPDTFGDFDEGAKGEETIDPKTEPGSESITESKAALAPIEENTRVEKSKAQPVPVPGEKSIVLSVPARKKENTDDVLKDSFENMEEPISEDELLSFGASRKAVKKIPKKTLEAHTSYTMQLTEEKSGNDAGICRLTFQGSDETLYEVSKNNLLWFSAFVDRNQPDLMDVTILLDEDTFAGQFEKAKTRLDGNRLILDLGYRLFSFDITNGELQRTQ